MRRAVSDLVQALADSCSPAEIEKGFDDYAAIGDLIAGGLQQQVEFDLQSFQRAAGRVLSPAEQERFRSSQIQALRWTYLGSGMTHPNFLATVGELNPAARTRIEWSLTVRFGNSSTFLPPRLFSRSNASR